MLLVVFYFFPTALVNSYKQHKNKSQLHLYLIAYLTIAFTSLGMLFKINHWPGASIMLFIGLPLPFVLFLPFYMRYHNKTKAKSDKNFFGVIFFMMYLAILSTLLAINVTKNTIDSIIPLIEESVSQSKILALRNDQLYDIILVDENNALKFYQNTTNNTFVLVDEVFIDDYSFTDLIVNDYNSDGFDDVMLHYIKDSKENLRFIRNNGYSVFEKSNLLYSEDVAASRNYF